MTNKGFRRWLERNGLTEAKAAKRLNLSLRTVWNYLASAAPLPRVVAMACWAYERGYRPRRQITIARDATSQTKASASAVITNQTIVTDA